MMDPHIPKQPSLARKGYLIGTLLHYHRREPDDLHKIKFFSASQARPHLHHFIYWNIFNSGQIDGPGPPSSQQK